MNYEAPESLTATYAEPETLAISRRSVITRIQLYVLLLLADLLAITFAFLAAAIVRPDPHWTVVLGVTLPIYGGVAVNTDAYGIDALSARRRGESRALAALLFTFGILFLTSYFLRTERDISRLMLLTAMGTSVALIVLFRFGADHVVRAVGPERYCAELVICDGVCLPAMDHVVQTTAERLRVTPDLRDPNMLDRFAAMTWGIDRVVIACPPEQRQAWAMLLRGANIRGEVLAREIDAVGAFGLNSIGDHTTLVVASGPLQMRDRILKRILDLAVCIPMLLLLAPVMLMIAIAVKIDSRGPVFFKQRRVGRGNAFFEINKFRSMKVQACDADGNVSTMRDDDRVTRVGWFIRRTSIDELPQLLNVLFGSMSLVGPRPHALGSLAGEQLFWDIDERYWHRHVLKPGITGLAQVRGYRGATHHRHDLTRRLQADLEYIAHWSIWRDVRILLSTLRVISGKHTY